MTSEFIDILTGVNPKIMDTESKNIILSGIIDSFDLINLIAKLEDGFDIEFEEEDVSAKNFESAASIWNLVQRRKEG